MDVYSHPGDKTNDLTEEASTLEFSELGFIQGLPYGWAAYVSESGVIEVYNGIFRIQITRDDDARVYRPAGKANLQSEDEMGKILEAIAFAEEIEAMDTSR